MLRIIKQSLLFRSPPSRIVALLVTLFLASCASIDIVNPDDPVAALPDRSAAILPGQTDRAAVRSLLGEPLQAGDRLRFDLFREGTTQTMVPIVLTPLPVPFGRMKDELLRYTLVSYDDSGRAAALASGIFRKPSEFRRTARIDGENAALHLRVGDLMFFVDPQGERRENLLVAPNARDGVLRRVHSPAACAVVLGCGSRGCSERLAVDGAPERRLPLRIVQLYWLKEDERESWMAGTSSSGTEPLSWLESLVALQLSPGEHALRFSSDPFSGEHEISLACRPGEIVYLMVNSRDNEHFFNRALSDWQVERLDSMPASFTRRPLVILYGGEWFVEAERAD